MSVKINYDTKLPVTSVIAEKGSAKIVVKSNHLRDGLNSVKNIKEEADKLKGEEIFVYMDFCSNMSMSLDDAEQFAKGILDMVANIRS